MDRRPFLLVGLLSVGVVGPAAAQCPDGSAPPCRAPTARHAPAPAPNSLAVLYFDNLSPDTADAYLADGLTDELIARLGQIERLSVTSRHAVQRYRGGAAPDPDVVGRELRVTYVVSGSVRRFAGNLRVTVELVRATTRVRVWGELYNRSSTDLLAIEADIAQQVAVGVAGRLLPQERGSLAPPTRNREAYDHYLRGLVHHSRRLDDPHAVLRALHEFEAAVALDPTFARAYARIGASYAGLLERRNVVVAGTLSPDTVLARGFAAVGRALELDSALSEAWAARGALLSRRAREAEDETGPARALEAHRRGRALDPRDADAHNAWGVLLLYSWGEADSSRGAFERALELDPGHPTYLQNLALVTFLTRRFEEARRWWDSAAAVAPRAGIVREGRAMVRLVLGDTAGARADALVALQLQPDWPWPKAILALISLGHGDSAEARAVAERLMAETPVPDAPRGLSVAAILTALGRHEEALDYLERVRPRVGYTLPLILRYVHLDPLRPSPRFQRLVERSRPSGGP
jgi:TolB-like protein/Flp pilus assembly protein TadD